MSGFTAQIQITKIIFNTKKRQNQKKRKYPLKQKKRRIKKLKKNQTAAEQEPIRHLKQINKKIPALNRDFL